MADIQYFYLGKNSRSNKLEGTSFKAYKYKDKETKKVTFYPIISEFNNELPKEIFIYGIGWKKIGKNMVEIPIFDNNSEHWDEYIDKYGVYCLFYSIDGSDYGTRDCCAIKKQTEFNSIVKYGITDYVGFMNNFMEFHKIQVSTIKDKYLPLIKEYGSTYKPECELINEYQFTPCYTMVYSFFSMKYSPNVLVDDERMEKLYRDYRKAELRSKSDMYKEYIALEDLCVQKYRELTEKYGSSFSYYTDDKNVIEYLNVKDKTHKLFCEVEDIINTQINKEIDTDNDVFPTSVNDRIGYLFGNEAQMIYSDLVKNYL